MVEMMTANKYYKNSGIVGYIAPGYIVLVNGQPTHLGTKKEAEAMVSDLNKIV